VGKKSVRLASRKSIGWLVDVFSVEKSRSLKFCITGQQQQPQPQPPTDSNPFCDIPEPYHISLEELIKVDKAAFNVGNFSCKLVNRLFPELPGDLASR
jgi:hypothetical protein